MSGRRVEHSPRMTKIVKGDPIQVGGRQLVPLVRVTSRMRRRAFVGSGSVRGGGWGFVHMRPVAIVDRSGAGEHRLRIPGGTGRWVAWLSLVLFVVPLVAVLLISLARRSDDKAT
jgi:CubicO group peptidase (beta-lactamase class C family)